MKKAKPEMYSPEYQQILYDKSDEIIAFLIKLFEKQEGIRIKYKSAVILFRD